MTILKEKVLGYSFNLNSGCHLVEIFEEYIDSSILQAPKTVLFFNAHSFHLSHRDKSFQKAIDSFDMIFPDGSGVVLASKLLSGNLKYRLTGYDFFILINQMLNKKKHSKVFFLGSSDNTLSLIKKRMKEDFEKIHVAGTYSPPFKEEFSREDNEKMISLINDSGADVLWVGMTQPKQEKWIHSNKDRLNVKLIAPIGAVFDFYAGTIKRPHVLFQKFGIETIGRFIQNPKKMWRRNLVSIPFFLRTLSKEFVKIKFRNLFKK